MPKISSARGPTIDGVDPSEIGGSAPVPPQEFDQGRFFNKGEKDEPEPDSEMEQEETPSVGTSSGPSSASKPKTTGKPNVTARSHRPARTTANPSK